MTRYIALLRGINVGPANRIRMETLRQLMENAGFTGVETYIQSGNVLFSSDRSEREAREAIRRALMDGAHIDTTLSLRPVQELRRLIDQNPFTEDEIAQAQRANPESESFYVCLLPDVPAESLLNQLSALDAGEDRFVVLGRDVYILLTQSIRTSKLAIRLQRILPDGTFRNWNTMVKLNERANADTEDA